MSSIVVVGKGVARRSAVAGISSGVTCRCRRCHQQVDVVVSNVVVLIQTPASGSLRVEITGRFSDRLRNTLHRLR